MNNKTRQWLLFVTSCILFLLLPVFFSPDFFRASYLFNIPPFQRDFLSYVLLLIVFYLCYFYVVPKLYFNRKYLWLGAALILFFVITVFLPDVMIHDHHPHDMLGGRGKGFPQGPERLPRPYFAFFILGNKFFKFLVVVAFAFLLRIHFRWKEAERAKTTTELSYLKAQVNPHFLFNTLNSIYSLAIVKSDKTANAIIKLSGLMRYTITDASNDFVPLQKEISYIEDYIELQKIRLDKTAEIVLDIKGDPSAHRIAPLILITFIENAFKYGVNPEENSVIRIALEIMESELKMTVFNNKVNIADAPEESSGMGIKNAEARLQMLYGGKYDLYINSSEKDHEVVLTLLLS